MEHSYTRARRTCLRWNADPRSSFRSHLQKISELHIQPDHQHYLQTQTKNGILPTIAMKTSTLLPLAFLTTLTTATPNPRPQLPTQEACDVSAQQFYLITASSPLCSSNSSLIPMASATSLFAPFHQQNLFLRTIGTGYNSLPLFTLENGSLKTTASDGFGLGEVVYGSPKPVEGAELEFLRDQAGNAGLTLTGGFLLGVGGVTDGWKLCKGDLGQVVVSGLLSVLR